ncbi:MAG: hypothetical protein ACI9WU_002797 [Myxococcota bacterium]|jgi:hypothetical protein
MNPSHQMRTCFFEGAQPAVPWKSHAPSLPCLYSGRYCVRTVNLPRQTLSFTAATMLLTMLLAAGGCSSISVVDVPTTPGPTERDRELCEMLCKKQQECVGLEVSREGIERCGAKCYTNLESQPALVARARASVSCLGEKCGKAYDDCTLRAESNAASTATYIDPSQAVPLSEDECRVVCNKTFECLGSTKPGRALEGCVLGCSRGSLGVEDLVRYRNVLRCAGETCGLQFQICTATKPTL